MNAKIGWGNNSMNFHSLNKIDSVQVFFFSRSVFAIRLLMCISNFNFCQYTYPIICKFRKKVFNGLQLPSLNDFWVFSPKRHNLLCNYHTKFLFFTTKFKRQVNVCLWTIQKRYTSKVTFPLSNISLFIEDSLSTDFLNFDNKWMPKSAEATIRWIFTI